MMLAKNPNETKTFKKVSGKNKWHYSCYIVILGEETRPRTEEETFLISINDISNFVPRKHLD